MAESKNNIVTQGLSGLVGRMLVFRQTATKTVVARRPSKSTKPPTAAQTAIKDRFRDAAYYARTAITDPAVKAVYQALAKPGQSAYNVAFSDYFTAPVIRDLDVSGYSGLVNQFIKVKASDDFGVSEVKVSIFSATDELIEEGPAVLAANGVDWSYKTTSANAGLAGSKVMAVAKDLAGNEGSDVAIM